LFVVGVVTGNSYTQGRVSPNTERTEYLSIVVCTLIASVSQVLSNVVNCNQTVPETAKWCMTAKQRRIRLVCMRPMYISWQLSAPITRLMQ